jgi:hypothetical protein
VANSTIHAGGLTWREHYNPATTTATKRPTWPCGGRATEPGWSCPEVPGPVPRRSEGPPWNRTSIR